MNVLNRRAFPILISGRVTAVNVREWRTTFQSAGWISDLGNRRCGMAKKCSKKCRNLCIFFSEKGDAEQHLPLITIFTSTTTATSTFWTASVAHTQQWPTHRSSLRTRSNGFSLLSNNKLPPPPHPPQHHQQPLPSIDSRHPSRNVVPSSPSTLVVPPHSPLMDRFFLLRLTSRSLW